MDKELTKNLIIKIDAASTDPDSIEQMQQINNDGFGLAFDIQAQMEVYFNLISQCSFTTL